jgi:uncharacterized membrane protein
MYSPNITLTNLIVKYLLTFELNIEKIKNTPLPYKQKKQLYEKVHAEDLNSLGEIIATPIGYSKALDIQRGNIDVSRGAKYKIFTNYRSTQDFINSYRSTSFIPVSSELISHLNKLLLKNILDSWELGKFRKFSEVPNEIYDEWYKYRDYYPKRNNERYFNEYTQWIYSDKHSYNKLIQCALLLYEFIDNAALFAGNQMTSFLTTTCILKEFGYNDQNTFCVAKALKPIHKDLTEMFKISKSKKDQTLFLEGILYAFSLESRQLKQLYESTFDKTIKRKESSRENLNDRQLKILEYLEKNKKINRAQCTKIMGVSFMTSYRDLTELVQAKYLEKKGSNKKTYYILKEKEDN